MKPFRLIHALLPAAAMSTLGLAAPGTSEAERLFTLKVKPLFADKCNGCHGDDPRKIKGDYNMLSREGLLAGGEEIGSDVLVPGDAAKSFLVTAVKWADPDFEMPPKENDRLSAEQIANVEAWINGGAPWPDAETQSAILAADREREVTEDGVIVGTSGGLDESWTHRRYQPEDIWSFQPVAKPEVPAGAPHPIDAFIRAKLKAAGIGPAPRAAPLTLLRRVTFDLTGLPPTPAETRKFLADWATDADACWDRTIDRLLASPRYGERWAQHWLDVVRYADTSGYSNDWERSNAWRYRDYVIRSLNRDKPWNRFIVEQLAGDELEPGNAELQIATGFLRMGPWEHTAMTPKVESRQLYLDDLVNITGQAFLSTTLRCTKCHDHKFDPIPTRDYYRLYAAFAATQPAEMPAAFLPEENRAGFARGRAHVEELLAFARKKTSELHGKREAAARAWYEERGLPYKDEPTRRPLKEPKPPRMVGLDTVDQGRLKVREQDVRIWSRCLERFEPLAQSVYNGGDLYPASQKLRPPPPHNKQKMARHNKLPETVIYAGGSVYASGEAVTPGVLSAIGLRTHQGRDDDPYRLRPGMEKRRLGLARWIAHRDNPLTTRSIANRVWHYHFGRGIAANPNNFGQTGGKPTHPELLDFLAATFVEQGWSLKKLHKLILTSETWKAASEHPRREALAATDPNNDLRAYFEPRRLTAEELRDAMLAVTGELSFEMGGLPVFPEINREVAFAPRMIQFSLAPAWQPSPTPAERNRRTIYAYRVRGLPDPLLEVFNRPSPDDSCELRDAPSVTPQVFTLLNSEVVTTRSIAFALRLEREADNLADRITRGYQLAYNRAPTESELRTLSEHHQRMVAHHREHSPAPTEYPGSITRSLVEEFSGDAFEYEELLNAYNNYTPDPQPADVSPETRALADIALLIFNANEYVFIY